MITGVCVSPMSLHRVGLSSHETRSLLSVMCCGDSQTYGGSVLTSQATAWRTTMWQALRAARGGVRMLGAYAMGVSGVAGPVLSPLPVLDDWRCAAQGGATMANIETQTEASETLCGAADVYILLGGENDLAAHSPPTSTVASLQASVLTWINARLSANPKAHIFVCDMVPHTAPCTDAAARDVISSAYNAALPAWIASLHKPRVHAVAAGSLLTVAELDSSGNHPTSAGYVIIGNAVASAILTYVSGAGAVFPRAVTTRAAVARASLDTDAKSITVEDTGALGVCPSGAGSWSAGVIYRPSTLAYAGHATALLSVGPAVGAGSLQVLQVLPPAGTVACDLAVYLDGNLVSVVNDALRANMTHQVSVVCDASDHSVSLFVLREGPGGGPETTCVSRVMGVAQWSMTEAGYLTAGTSYTVPGSVGLVGDLWVARATAVTPEQLEAWYLDGTRPAGATAFYPCSEGAGIVAAPDVAYPTLPNGVATCAWSAAGAVLEPWHATYLTPWLHVDSALGISLDGSSKVQTWANQGGTGPDLAQSVGVSRPGYTATPGSESVDFASGTVLQNICGAAPVAYTASVVLDMQSAADAKVLLDMSFAVGPTIITSGGNITIQHGTTNLVICATATGLQCLDVMWTGLRLWARKNGGTWQVANAAAPTWSAGTAMGVGAYSNSVYGSSSKWRELWIDRRCLSTAELAARRATQLARYGV